MHLSRAAMLGLGIYLSQTALAQQGAAPRVPEIATSGAKVMRFDAEANCSDGLCGVNRNGRWGAIDYHGNLVLDFAYEADELHFSEGFAAVRIAGPGTSFELGFIDKHGTRQFSNFSFLDVLPFSDGVAWVTIRAKDKKGFTFDRSGYIDHQGSIKFQSASLGSRDSFREGRVAATGRDPATGGAVQVYLDHNLNVVCSLPTGLGQGTAFSEGVAWVYANVPGQNPGWLAIDTGCRQLFPYLVKQASPYSDGIAAVVGMKDEGEFIDKAGKNLLKAHFNPVSVAQIFESSFQGGHALVAVRPEGGPPLALIDKTGTPVNLHGMRLSLARPGPGLFMTDQPLAVIDGSGTVLFSNIAPLRPFPEDPEGLAYGTAVAGTKSTEGFFNRKGEFMLIREH